MTGLNLAGEFCTGSRIVVDRSASNTPRMSTLSYLPYPAARAACLQYRTTRAEQRVVTFGATRVEYDNDIVNADGYG